MNNSSSDLVYSTSSGRICPGCGTPIGQCVCRKMNAAVKGSGKVKISQETKGRKGKTVTLITGLPQNEEELTQTARLLKQKIGTGGTVQGNTIEIQGDHRKIVLEELLKRGFNAKIAGG